MSGQDAAYAAVAVPVPIRRLFTYRVPEVLRGELTFGARVRVTFARRKVAATVVEYPAPPPALDVDVKEIEEVLAAAPPLDASLMDLTKFVSDYYLCSWGEAIETALPPSPKPLTRPSKKKVEPKPEQEPSPPQVFTPTPQQARALETLLPAVAGDVYAPFLLFGATGSGKTEVYLRAAERALARGRGVLYLVPEIGLTPLLVSRLTARFPGEVAVLHSGLAPRARREAWDAVRAGRRRLAVGARSAVFAPLADPGLIIVDEEQDGSYKQEDAPRYNGRDLAVVRAKRSKAVVILGSATPSLESFQHAKAGRYTLIRLGGRVGDRPLPTVELVDMRREFKETKEAKPLSRALVAALVDAFTKGEQALVLRNRRGWAPSLLCQECGQRVTCTRCAVAMTWHRVDKVLRCHYCGRETPVPKGCPSCRAEGLHPVGEGTERIEDDLRLLLPKARIERMDRDTVRRRGAHEEILRKFERREIDILVGTQMIAKGHDFPNVTVVGVLSADQTLGLPDFRAGERAFQLLTQVAGRAGRGTQPGRVVVQAFDPQHPVLAEAAAQDYEAFYDREILYRRALRYPPLTALVQLLVVDKDEARAWRWSQQLADALQSDGPTRLMIGGPGPAPLSRLKGKFRQQILVRTAGRRRLVAAVDAALATVEKDIPQRAVHVDVDPVNLL